MENKINIAELLKDCPKGMELDCTICNGVKFIELDRNHNFPILVRANNGYEFNLTKYGQIHNMDDAKCVIFPKGKTTWEGFVPPCKFKDGDVVACDNPFRNILQLFIFKDKKEDEICCNCYLILDGDKLCLKEGKYYVTRLATEEEKQKLFDAIKNNKYKWNAETKTLEKLLKFKVGDRIRHKDSHIYCTLEEYSEGISAYRTNIGLSLTYKDLEQWELFPNKFDISTLKPFDEVLVRQCDVDCWKPALWGRRTIHKNFPFITSFGATSQAIPFKNNEWLVGTTDDCDDYYKTWK